MRKQISSVFEIAAALCFFWLPPVFTKTTAYVVTAFYNVPFLFLFALYSCWFFISAGVIGAGIERKANKPFKTIRYAVLCALTLIAASVATSALSEFAGGAPETVITGEWAPGFWFFVNNIVGAFVFASFEEILYRVFLPIRLRYFKIPEKAAYAVPLVLFALAHRPLGIWGIANAFLCGASLQYCYNKTGSVAAICAVHGTYNLTGRALMFFA
ncbi:hypothetical protein AGMMS49531_05860 [Endomicrobiia bacterium]|nr:hypothetical protein AGMMS49531_05860 [Endomicrobiia bacterium]